MNDHVSLEGLHDFVHDFGDQTRREEIVRHAAACDACREEMRRLTSEREAVSVAMEEAPAPSDADVDELKRRLAGNRRSATLSWAPFSVAAAVMVGLLGMLFSGTSEPVRNPAQETKKAPREPRVKRFTQILTEESKHHRDLAVLALASCGSAGWDSLKQCLAVNPNLGPLLAPPKPANNPALVARMEKMQLDTEFEETQLADIISYFRDFAGLNFLQAADLPSMPLTLKTTGVPMNKVVDLLCEKAGGEWYAAEDAIVIRKKSGLTAPTRGAVRLAILPAQIQAAKAAVAKLTDDQVTVRDAATNDLRKLGFAAEDALWEMVDASDAEVRAWGEKLLRELYTAPPPRRPEDHPSRAIDTRVDVRIDLDFVNMTLGKAMEYLHEVSELNYVLTEGADRPITVKVHDLAISKCLEYILQQCRCTGWFDGDVFYVVNPGRLATSEATPWVRADRCEAIEAALDGLASGRNVSFQAFDVDGVHALRAANYLRQADELEAALSTQFWFTDRDFFPKEAGPLMKKLESPVDLDTKSSLTMADAFARITKQCGVTCTWKSSGMEPVATAADFQFKKAKASDVLAAIARKFGRRIRIEGASIVVE